ncbi:MAG: glycosyltransferase family A protein [Actinomycetota bacterium]
MTQSAAADIAVILPTYNGAPHLAQQLEALRHQDIQRDWELVVVDAGSSDGTIDIVEAAKASYPVPIRTIQLHGAPGINAGLNEAIASVHCELLAIAEQDDVVEQSWLRAITTCLRRAHLVGSRLDTARLNTPAARGTKLALTDNPRWNAPTVVATGMGVRRELWTHLRGFDESFRYGGNDIEFCIRAAQAGFPSVVCQEAVVHYRLRTTPRSAYRQAKAYGVAWAQLHKVFGHEVVPRRGTISVLRDWARVCRWLVRGVGDERYRMRACYRLGENVGYVRGSVRHRVLYL